jgi:hypothetical protein
MDLDFATLPEPGRSRLMAASPGAVEDILLAEGWARAAAEDAALTVLSARADLLEAERLQQWRPNVWSRVEDALGFLDVAEAAQP